MVEQREAPDKRQKGWYFGWNIVAASSLLTMLTVGMRMGIGPFFLPMLEDLGMKRELLSGVIAIGMLLYGVGMPIAGYLVARKGTRFVILLGTAIVVTSIIWTVYATNYISFFLAYGVLLSLGAAFTSPVAFTPIVSRWFTRRRGMALFFLSTGSMAGIAILTPLFSKTILLFGWRETLIGYAIAFMLATLPIAFFIMRESAPLYTDLLPEEQEVLARKEQKEAEAQQKSVDKTTNLTSNGELGVWDAVKTSAFWKVCAGIFVCGFSMNLLGTHGVPMLVDHGFTETTSGFGIGLIGLVAIFSTIVLGRLSDVVERRALLALIYTVRGIGFIGLVAVMTPWQLYTVAAVCGMAWAGNMALSSAILSDLYGVKLVGILYGWAFLGHQIGAMISAWLGGWAYQQYGTHWIAFGAAALLLFMGGAISLMIPRRSDQLKPISG